MLTPSSLADSDAWYNYYHGTGQGAVTSLQVGLSESAAATATNRGGPLGFYLATTYDHARVYAEDRYPGVVLQFSMNGDAQASLIGAGATFRDTFYGRGQTPGVEFYIPPSAFGVFNAQMQAGRIRIVPLPGGN